MQENLGNTDDAPLTNQDLTSQELVLMLEDERKQCENSILYLHPKKLVDISKCCDLAVLSYNAAALQRNTPKKRAHGILRAFWLSWPEVFVLCALAVSPNRLGSLKATDYLQEVSIWWTEAEHPESLAAVVRLDVLVGFGRKFVADPIDTVTLSTISRSTKDNPPMSWHVSNDIIFEYITQGEVEFQFVVEGQNPVIIMKKAGMVGKFNLNWDLCNTMIHKNCTRASQPTLE